MDDDQVMKVLRSFGKAFNKGDVVAILECVTDDFEWRLAAGPDAPDGRIVSGKSAVRDALAERDEFTESMRFSETSVHIAGETIFGCFRATGELADGTKIDKRGVDIYQFRDGKIAVKDSYWKHIT
jgi:ketosteroid isomerase-like protein